MSTHAKRSQARHLAMDLCSAALEAVEPAAAVRAQLRCQGTLLLAAGQPVGDLGELRSIRLVGAGKASPAMALAVEEILGERLEAGLCVAKAGQLRSPLPRRVEVLEGGHPLPDAAGLAASHRLLQLVDGLGDRDLLVVLLSGGASSLLALPAPGLELAELQQTTRLLLGSGAPIQEMNVIRRHLSAIGGGQLAARAAPAAVLVLVLSDVMGDALEAIGSGPCAPDPSTFAEALRISARYQLVLPAPVRAVLEQGARGERAETLKPGDPRLAKVRHVLCGSNQVAAQAACRRAEVLGLRSLLLAEPLQGEAREAGQGAAALLRELALQGRPLASPACLVMGGETTVTWGAAPIGRGGRNQELALSAALAMQGLPESALLVVLATDGGDGPTDAAGAIVDGDSVARGQAAGLCAREHLEQHDAYPFLEASGDLLRLGPTGTNVNDLCFLIAL